MKIQWNGFWDGLITVLILGLCVSVVGFILAWLTVLPTIGLLYFIGYI